LGVRWRALLLGGWLLTWDIVFAVGLSVLVCGVVKRGSMFIVLVGAFVGGELFMDSSAVNPGRIFFCLGFFWLMEFEQTNP
jgi:hypothetical protein